MTRFNRDHDAFGLIRLSLLALVLPLLVLAVWPVKVNGLSSNEKERERVAECQKIGKKFSALSVELKGVSHAKGEKAQRRREEIRKELASLTRDWHYARCTPRDVSGATTTTTAADTSRTTSTTSSSSSTSGNRCNNLSGDWYQTFCHTTWKLTGSGSSYSAQESGCGNARGQAMVLSNGKGNKVLRIDWKTDRLTGFYEWVLNETCTGGTGVVGVTAPTDEGTKPSALTRK